MWLYKCRGEREDFLLLLGSGSAGAIDGLLNLTGNTVLSCVELGANGAVLGERSTDLLRCVLVSIAYVLWGSGGLLTASPT